MTGRPRWLPPGPSGSPPEVALPLLRIRDKQPVGTLMLIRTKHTELYDPTGKRHATPRKVDVLIATVTSATGEEISWPAVLMAELEGPVVVEPPDPDDPDKRAFQGELRGEV